MEGEEEPPTLEPQVPYPISADDAPGNHGKDEEESVVEYGPRARALTNEYILKEILDYLSAADLKNCLLVNPLWNQVATRAITPKASAVQFGVCGGRNSHPLQDMPKFMEMLSNNPDVPFTKIHVHSDVLRKADSAGKNLMVRFFGKVAPVATHLKLFSRNNKFFPNIYHRVMKFPKLKSLELCLPGARVVRPNVDFMIEVINHAPKLESFSFAFGFIEQPVFLRVIDHVPNQIRHLHLHGELEDVHLQRIAELGTTLQLKTFELEQLRPISFGRQYTVPNGRTLQVFLEHQCNTLEKLKMQFLRRFDSRNCNLPRFPNLKELQIQGMDPNSTLLAVPSLSNIFPALHSLSICAIDWHQLRDFISSQDMQPLETVKELKLDPDNPNLLQTTHVMYVSFEEAVELIVMNLAVLFPSVRKLTLPYRPVLMRAIDQGENVWPDLKELSLFSNPAAKCWTVDYILTGYKQRMCTRLNALSRGHLKRVNRELAVEKRIPTFWHQLKVLEFQHTRVWKDNFTDVSCQFVLLKLKNLECLNILEHKTHTISEQVLREMSEKFKVLYKPKTG